MRRRPKIFDEDGNACLGLCSYSTNEIFIESGLSGDKELDTYLHEWLHAYFHSVHLDLDRKLEEMLVEGLTYELLKSFKIKC